MIFYYSLGTNALRITFARRAITFLNRQFTKIKVEQCNAVSTYQFNGPMNDNGRSDSAA